MLNTASLNAVNTSTFSSRFVKPLYDSYCFSNIPQMVQFLLTGEGQSALPLDVFGTLPTRYDKVILFFIDAFGWRFFERYAEKYALLKTILSKGVVSKMTSQFPSTTAAHTTCIHTGLDVGQSGVYEWHYYEPLVDDIISPLLFSYARDKERDMLKHCGIPAEAFYPQQTIYQALNTHGIASYVFQSRAYTPSTFSQCVFQGAKVIPFDTLPEALIQLSELVLSEPTTPAYYYLYFDKIDSSGHVHGLHSPPFEKAVDNFFTLMEQILYQQLSGKVRNTLLVLTADHGQVEVNPRTTFYLNRDAPKFEQYLLTNRQGKLLVPAGSARDMFLYVHVEKIDEAMSYLQQQLVGRAEVYRTQTLVEQGFFGTQAPSPTFFSRVGNVVILPYEQETVWWYEAGTFEMRFSGHHGGLLPEEMEIPLTVFPL